jgi:hypothetical protein
MFSTKSYVVTGVVLCELLGWQAAEARVTGQYYYELTAKDRSDAPNEVYSTLGLGISDNLVSSKAPTEYSLETSWTHDSENNVTNEQYSGYFTGKYIFSQPSLWWNYFGEVDVIPVDTGIKIDDLRSQNLSTVSTGPTISLWKNLRGSVDLTALASTTRYSDSNLDSKGKDITLDYFYPYSEIMSLTYTLGYKEVNYDDVSTAINDFDVLGAGITINRDTETSNFELIVRRGDVEHNNITSQENVVILNMGYQINAFSNISMEISDSLQTATEFNRLDNNPNDAIFISDLLRNKRFQLGYDHVTTDTIFEFQIFTNNLENTFDTIVSSEKVSGAVFTFSNNITDNLNLFMGLESTDYETRNERFDDFVVRTTYTRQHSKRLYSEIEFTIENYRLDNVDSTDTWIQYRITSKLF